ncbi:glycosyltransferase [Xanthomonas sp. XNM01]|uniref:glycosyltransferase n=1 Tax=Xanthomonas sp. XNM01 TaxID=2769289 RepID=UPI001CE05612|nr:glycosyltransferase [Xanthomonas sp. XNM01]
MTSSTDHAQRLPAGEYPAMARLEVCLQHLVDRKIQLRAAQAATAHGEAAPTPAQPEPNVFAGRLVAIENATGARRRRLLAAEHDWQPAPLEMVDFAIPHHVREARPLACPQYSAEFENARVVAGIGAVLDRQAGEIVSDAVYRNHHRINTDWYIKYRLDAVDPLRSRCFSGRGQARSVANAVSLFSWENRNYAHWLIEKLASMRWIGRARLPDDTVLLVEAGLPATVVASLELFWPSDRIVFVERGEAVDVGRLFYFSDAAEIWEPRDGHVFDGSDYRICPEAMRWLAGAVRERVPTVAVQARSAYLIRPPGGNGRAVANQEALIALLQQHDHDCIQPASLDFAAQVNYFSGLDLAISPSGAALANLLWMRPGSTVVVLAIDVPEMIYWFYHALAAAIGVRLVFFPVQGIAHPQLPKFHWDTEVPAVALTQWLARNIDGASASPAGRHDAALPVQATGPVDVTVAVMSYNNAAHIGETVRSVLAQQGVSLELIVRDDCSTDASLEVLAAFAGDPRFTLERNVVNRGMYANYNRCVDSGSGRYVVVLGSDDIMYPGHLASLVACMDAHPQAALGYTQCNWIDGDGALIRYADHPGHRKASYCGQRNEVADLLAFDDYVTPSAMILRRDALDRVRLPDGRIHDDMPAGDWDLTVRVAEVAPDFVFLRQPSLGYRVHGSQISTGFYASNAPLDNHLRILEGVFRRGNQHLLRGREQDVAALLRGRLAQYPAERDTPLGQRAVQMLARLDALKHVPTGDMTVTTAATPGDGPLFSIILTTYNRPALLADALASVGAQTLRDFEVVLINDAGSPVEALLAGCDFPVHYIRQPTTQGPSAARNAGLRLATGRFVAYLDDDDIFLPDHLEVLAEALEARPDTFVYTEAEYVAESLIDGQRIEQGRSVPFRHERYDRDRLFARNYIPVNTWAHPRSMLREVGAFDTSLAAFEDWDLLLRLAARFPFFHVARTTVEVHTRVAGAGDDHLSGRERKNFPELYRTLYARHPGTGSARLLQARSETARSMGFGNLADEAQPRVTLDAWLERRVPSPAQGALISAHFSATPPPTIAVIVLDADGDRTGLERTFDSLVQDSALQPHLQVFAVTALAEAEPAHAATPRHVAIGVEGVPGTINGLLAAGDFDWFVLVQAGDRFTASGLGIVAQELIGAPGMRAIYADEIMTDGKGQLSAMLRPGFNLDLLLSMPSSMARHWLYRRDVVVEAGGFDPAFAESPEYELLLRLIDTGGLDGLGHVDEPLLLAAAPESRTLQVEIDALQRHLRNRGYEQAQVGTTLPGCYRIDYGHPATPGVSILVPTRNQLAPLRRCLETLLEKTAYRNYEVLIIDNGSTDEDARTWLAGIEAMDSPQMRVLRHGGPHNQAAMLNFGAAQARGDYLLLLDPNTAVVKDDWLDAMLNHAQRPEVGIVGAKLLHNDGRVQHAGLVLGLRDVAATPFIGLKHDDPGYMFRLQVDQDYSAVSSACLMIRREVFDSVGTGLDEAAFPLAFGGVDLCLKVRSAGYLVVWTPHAVLMHDVVLDRPHADQVQLEQERDAMLERWLPLLARDPAYNQSLTLFGVGYQVDTRNAINWRPLRWRPRPVALTLAADKFGCGHYRIIEPTRAMNEAGLADAHCTDRYQTPVDIERLSPDVIVLQRQMFKDRLEPVKRLGRFSRAFKVAELDDYLPNIPLKSAHKGVMPKDILRTMRESLKLVDRFVVSTAPLAEAFAGMHDDIRVVENHLPPRWWSQIRGGRRDGPRPRVGWGGGAGHRGDLELIADVVKALADEVDWVFFGMCPDNIRPYVREFHEGVSIEEYPARLAGLDLDLALAPLEDNLFNRCKSNLRLLEYGACGYPVVCSDIEPYQGSLPVTRVKPRFRDWVDAIRMHTQDLDAAARAGEALREVVQRDWMLDERHAAFWLSQWLPD